MDNNQNPFAFLNDTTGAAKPKQATGGSDFSFLQAQDKTLRAALTADDLGLLAKEEGAAHLMPVINAIYGQESGAGANGKTSTDGARGGMQVMPDTFRRFAKQGESIDNPADNMRVGMRIIKTLGDKFGNDPAKIATGYFSGEGNVNSGSGSAWKNDHKDGNGKSVSGYVSDVLGRLSPVKEAKADESLPDLSQFPKWGEIAASPRFMAMTDDEKTKLKGDYFDDVLAPHAGAEAIKARAQFMAQRDTAPSLSEKTSEKMAGIVPEVKKLFGTGSVMDGFDANAPQTGMANLQDAMKSSQTLRDVDGSVENRQARLERLGINKGLAGRLAKEGAANGVLPGEETKGIDMLAVSPAKNSVGDVATGLASGLKEDFAQAAGTGIRGVGNFLSEEAIGNKDLSALGAQIEKFGADIYKNSKKREGKNQPTFETETGQGLYGGARSLSQLLTYFAATGGNPTAALGLMVGQTGAQGAGEALEKGKDFFTAGSYGAGQAALEYATEKMPMGYLAKHLGKEGFKQFVGGFLLRELPSEQVATLTQDALQKALLEPEKTWSEYAQERPSAAYQTLLATGVMAGGMGALNKGIEMNDAYQADLVKQKALGRWNAGLLGVPREAVQSVQTPDGRIEPNTAPMTSQQAAAAEPTPIDVHPTSAVADSIVADLATQNGIPHELVLPQQKNKLPGTPESNDVNDQDVMDYAEMRHRQLLAKLHGRIEQVPTDSGLVDQEVPGQALTPEEQAELNTLETQNPSEIRSFYGMNQPIPSDQSANQSFAQTPAPAVALVEQPAQGTVFPTATEPGLVAAQENQNAQNPTQAEPIGSAPSQVAVEPTGQPVGATTEPQPADQDAAAQANSVQPVGVTNQQVQPKAPVTFDVSGRNEQQLRYLAEHGQPGWKEAAQSALADMGVAIAPQGQFKTADEAQAYISTQRRRAGGKLPKALPLPMGDGSFGVVTEGQEGFDRAAEYAKANAPKTEKESKAQWIKNVVSANRLMPAGMPSITGVENGRLNINGDPRTSKQGRALASAIDEAIKRGATADDIWAAIQGENNGTQAAETIETQAQEPQASDAGAGKGVSDGAKQAAIPRKDFEKHGSKMKPLNRKQVLSILNKQQAADSRVKDFIALTDKTMRAERISDPATWSQGERDAHESGDANLFSKLRGYSDEEISAFNQMMQASREVAFKYGDVFAQALSREIGDANGYNKIAAREKAEQDAPRATVTDPAAMGKKASIAPGTRANGATERKAADRLEKLYDQMGVITERNSREGNAKAAVRGIVEELRKPKTVTSVEAILEKASSDLTRKYGAFSGVIDEVVDSLKGQNDELDAEMRSYERKAAPETKPVADAIQKQFANNKVFTADKVEAARARLRSKLTQLNSGIDPEVIMDGMTIAGAYIEAGVRKFADYAKAMTDDFGDTIKPYLLSFYEAARNYPGIDNEGMSTVDEAKAEHDTLVQGMSAPAKEELKEVIGTTASKPAKRTKKTGSKTDMTLTQDWGVEHIDGYGTEFSRETGNDTKDAFLKEAKTYLTTIAGILTEQGYLPQKDSRGRDMKPVSVNESGVAGSGEASLTMYHSDGHGIYANIGESSLRGVVPTTKSGIAILFRAASEQDKYGSKGTNRWAPVDLSAADLAIMLDKEAKQNANNVERARATAILGGEVKTNDTQSNQNNAGAGSARQQPDFALAPDNAEPSGRVPAADNRQGAGVNRGSQQSGDRGVGDDGQSGVRSGSNGTGESAEQPVQSRRGSSSAASNRGSAGARSGLGNYRIQPGELTREGSWKTTAERNVEIVELVKAITAENRQPTTEERAKLVKFTGWGASEVANGVFPDRYGRYKDASWQALGERLKAALTEEEYAQAKRTTQYAHYTSDPVIRSIYDGLERMGFAGGSILEPGMGIGHFAGLMPDGIAANSQYTGIEYDTITGNIAKMLYPDSNIIVGDYTRTNLPRDFFDVGIGNPPFSSTQILSDPEYKSLRPMLHDYFFMKTIDRIKRGGLQIFVTSKGTMDKSSDKSRKYLAKNAILLGAIRLPQTAFKDNAGTEVVTDIIFLQKRGEGVQDNGIQWMNTKEVQTPDGPAMINEYFADHPEMVLGKHALQGSMYRANEYTVLPPDGDIEKLFARAIKNLPENVFRPESSAKSLVAATVDREFNPKHKKEGGLYLSDSGKLMQVDNGTGVEVNYRTNAEGKQIALTEKQKKWLKDYVGLRDAVKQAQFDQLNNGDWEKSLKALNKTYDAFVKANGQILEYTTIERTNKETGETVETKRFKNDPLLRLDAEGALAYALESVREDGAIVKGAILNGRVLERPKAPEIKTTQDALFVSLNNLGGLNVDDVAALSGTDKDTVIRDLGTSIYEAPGAGWELADEYLSGNVVRKLKEAKAAAEVDAKYKRNVEALLAVQPRPLGPTDITVRLGANWVPASDVAKFAEEVIGDRMEIKYSPLLNKWDVEQQSRSVSEWGFDKAQSGVILDAILNNRQIKITWRDSEGKTHVDLESTEKANDIATKMRERFRSWVWTDPKRAERLVNYYNDNFNNIAPRQFDGSHLTLPGVSSRFNLYPHQKRAVWRIVQQGDTYLAHAVGAGKTMEMIAGGMEERRLGLIKKPMYVVPNHMLAQFSREFLELYPTANIMVADEHNFHSSNRKRFVAQAALNNPDAIVITHAAFGRIGMSEDYYQGFINKQIDEWKEALDDVDKGDRITRKQIERRIEQLEQRLEGRQSKDKKDQVLTFEELGVDKLFVDEFHEFRKLDFATNQGNVKGIDPNGSQRALDLYMKVEYLRGKNPGRALVAASGTPVTNTMGELYTAQRFFQPEQMQEDGLASFDAWASQYGDIVTGFEQNAAGGYEMVARFAKFQNVPELMRRVRSFMDILTSSNLGELVQRPDVIDGGRQVEVTPVPEGYKEYQQQLQERIKKIRNRKGPPKKGEDIILNVIGDGRFSAIDMRFVNPEAPSDPTSKLNTAIDRMIGAYNETKGYEYATKDGKVEPIKGASIILFTDIGLGEQSAASRGFDMRGWIEKRLTEAGIPREHIAFMRDHKQHAKKERLFADMRSGKKRILIGGKEMETGTNVQKRLSHLFHLDAPWFPASVEQREGRIVRQGNQNKAVKITALATKGSYDSTMWGMNARKARFIEQAMNGDDSVRSLEDVSEASAFEMAAALASGDERYLKLAGLKADVERLERLRQAHYDDQNKLTRDKHWTEESVKRNTGKVKDIEAALAKRQPIRAGEFAAQVAGKKFDNREEFGTAMFQEFEKLSGTAFMGEKELGQIGGFPIKFFGIKMQGSGGYAAALHVELPDSDALLTFPLDTSVSIAGIATRAANQVNGLDRLLAETKALAAQNEARVEQITKRLGSTFSEESLLLEKVAELNALESELAAESAANEAEAANEAGGEIPPVDSETNLSRGRGGKGIALRDLKAVVDRARASLKNLPQIHVLKSPESLDRNEPTQSRLYERIQEAGAENDVEGATHDGEIYLFADNLADEFRAEHVLVNHEVGHYGLREVFGKNGLDPILNTIYMTNTKVRKQADALRERLDLASNAEATEEVLVEMEPKELIKLNAWRRLVRYVRDWLEFHGFGAMAKRLNSLLKVGMTDQQKADVLVADVISAARAWVRNGTPSQSTAVAETKLSQADQTDSGLVERDRTNIETATRRMDKFVTEAEAGKLKDSDTQILGPAPTVLQALGASSRDLQIDGATVRKVLFGKHKFDVSASMLRQVAQYLYDPLAVFDSANGSGMVLLTEVASQNGKPIVAIVHLDKRHGALTIHDVASVHEKSDAESSLARWINDGLLRYVRNENDLSGAATRHPLPASIATLMKGHLSNVLTERDIVKQYGPKFSRKPIGEVIRDLQSNVVQFYGNQDLKTFNGLNKTINTQFHKALKDKDFGRVYNLIQSMQNHVATASSRPAELAPGILHRVDNVGQAVKTLVSKSQRQAIEKAGDALFAGTLSGNSVLDGRVWSEAELREKFGLDDTGVALYQQARQAIDASLMELAAAEAYAIAETYLPKALRADIIESPDDAEALIMAALGRQIDMARKANLDEATQASMADAREKAQAIFEQAEKLKKAGYAPLMRFGKYDLKVMAIDPATGNVERDENDNPVTLYYGRFESQSKLRDMERQLQARYADKLNEIRITPGVVNESANELYRGVNPETMSIFAEAIGASQAMDDYIRLVRSERSAMKRRLERKGTAGYSTDVQRVLANFITSNARQSAQQLFGTSVNRAIRRIPREKGDVQKEAILLRDYVVNPNDNGALGSSLMFAWFLGGSPAAAAINMTQPVMMTLPFLSQYGAVRAATALTKAVPYAMGAKEIADRDLRQALKTASLQGIVDAQEVFHLYAIGSRQLSAGPRSQALMTLWGSMFSAVEGMNRRLTFIAAWNIAVDQGNKDPYEFAVNAVNQTQGIYNKANRPNWARSSGGRAVFTFKTYSIMYVELMHRMWNSGAQGKKAVLLMMAVLILAAGINGLPGADLLDAIIDRIGQWMGYDTNMKRWKRRHAYELLGKVAGDLVLYGASSMLPLDFGGRLGLGNMIPGAELVRGNYMRGLAEIVGPTAGAAQQVGDAIDAADEGNYGQATKNLLPKAGRDLWNAVDMGYRGYARDAAGRKTVETTGADAVIKGIGFNPTVVAEKTRATMPIQQDIQLVKKKETSIVNAWAQAVVDGDQNAAKAQADRLSEWNRDNPDNPIRITPDQIRSRAKLLQTDKGSRITKTAPKEIRGRVGLELLKQ